MAAADVKKTDKPEERVTPEFRDLLQPIGYASNDFSIVAPEAMTIEDLTDPAAWAIAKQRLGGYTLATGDMVRVIHPEWFAIVLIDQAGRGETCRALVMSVTRRLRYAESERGRLAKGYRVVQDRATGHWRAMFERAGELVLIAEHAVEKDAVDAANGHADRVARK